MIDRLCGGGRIWADEMRKRDEAKFALVFLSGIGGGARRRFRKLLRSSGFLRARIAALRWYWTGLRDGVFLHHLEAPILLRRASACRKLRDRTINMHREEYGEKTLNSTQHAD